MRSTMSKKKSIISDKLDYPDQIKQKSTDTKPTSELHRIDRPMLQNVRLIWLDNDIDSNSTDYYDTINQFQCVLDTIDTFNDCDECVDFLTDIETDNFCIIISDILSQNVVPMIQAVTRLRTIFIYCRNKTQREQWASDCPKVKGTFSEISSICKALKLAVEQCERNAIAVNFMNTSDNICEKKLDQLEPSFMYTQLFKDILSKINFEPKHFNEFIAFCHEALRGNQRQLKYVDEFQKNYSNKSAILWYTREYFLYNTLNRALRLMEVNLIITLGFFIGDIHRHIEHLHKEQYGDPSFNEILTVYRGQGLTKEDFEKLLKTKGGLISFNNFLSTTTNLQVSKTFAESNQQDPDLVAVLFIMTIDPSKSSAPFASIAGISQFQGEDEVLFSMHTVFRIDQIIPTDENHSLLKVQLTLTTDNDKDLRVLTEWIREEFKGLTQWDALGQLLCKLGHMNPAEQIYQLMLNDELDETKRAGSYHMLGSIKLDQGKYNEAISFYEESITIKQKSLSSNHPNLARSYNNIGSVYDKMGEYSKALLYYEKALAIKEQLLPFNHPSLAGSCNNIAVVCTNMGEYSQALSYYERALSIQRQSLPSNHPDLANSYNNIGMVYLYMSKYSEALLYNQQALAIRQKSLPSNHLDLAGSYNNIGMVHDNMGEYTKALFYYEKALAIKQQMLACNHPSLAGSYHNTGMMYYNMGEYSKALLYYEKAVAIQKQLLPSSHSDFAMLYNGIGMAYFNTGEYSRALSYYEKALPIQQQSLPSNHPDLALSYNNMGLVYDDMGEYSKALWYYKKALPIQQQSLPSDHPHLALSYNNIGVAHYNMGQYSKALSYYEKALAIQQQSLPSNHPDLAMSYNNIGLVYDNMSDYAQALCYYEKALAVQQQPLHSNHPNVATSYNNIGTVYYNMGEYSRALSYYEKTLAIQHQTHSSDHPDFSMSYNNIGAVYFHMGEYSQALLYYEKALRIQQQSLPFNHPNLAKAYIAQSVVYNHMEDHCKSLRFYEKAFQIRHQLVRNCSNLNLFYGHASNIYSSMSRRLKTLLFWQLALDIAEHSLPKNHSHREWCRKKLENAIKEF